MREKKCVRLHVEVFCWRKKIYRKFYLCSMNQRMFWSHHITWQSHAVWCWCNTIIERYSPLNRSPKKNSQQASLKNDLLMKQTYHRISSPDVHSSGMCRKWIIFKKDLTETKHVCSSWHCSLSIAFIICDFQHLCRAFSTIAIYDLIYKQRSHTKSLLLKKICHINQEYISKMKEEARKYTMTHSTTINDR
jgi:hypothetical protein